jgi:hypothetical protein
MNQAPISLGAVGHIPLTGVAPLKSTPEAPRCWADDEHFDVTYKGISVRAILLALSMLRSKDPDYNALTIQNRHALGLIVKVFEREFGTELPPPEMARELGAVVSHQDAQSVMHVLLNDYY